MTIEQTKVIDSVHSAKVGGDVILPILAFIETGQLHEDFPALKGRGIVISLYSKYPLSEQAQRFFELARKTVKGAGFELEFVLLPPH